MNHTHRPKSSSHADNLFEYRSVEKRKLKLTMAITGITMVVEVIGGFMTNSLALISDAGHMFTHFFALAVSFGAILYANKEICHHRTFGFFRVEILAALFNSLFLLVVTIWIFIEGVSRILHPEPILGMPMFIIAVIGFIVNLISALILHGTSKDNLNVKSAFVHMMADTVSSIVIIIGAVIIYVTGWNIVDPILSIGIGVVILSWGWGLFRDSVNILLESTPKGLTTDDVSKTLMTQIPVIEAITDIHVWEITSMMYSMTAHIKLNDTIKRTEEKNILKKIKQIVDDRFDIEHTTIEFE